MGLFDNLFNNNDNQNNNDQNNNTNTNNVPGVGVTVNNPHWMQPGQPMKFVVWDTGNGVYIQPKW